MNEMDNRRTILHVLAGGYLLYLAYSIVKGIISGETPADRALLMGVCAAAFGLVGAYLLIHALIVRVKTAQNPPEQPDYLFLLRGWGRRGRRGSRDRGPGCFQGAGSSGRDRVRRGSLLRDGRFCGG